jgi:RNA polymerase sigma factor (sigma-70 family)
VFDFYFYTFYNYIKVNPLTDREESFMADGQSTKETLNTEQFVQEILSSVEREREREIVARRFGLFDRKETLEQIGELLGITRERVRQLEKSVIARLQQSRVTCRTSPTSKRHF